MSTAVPKPKLRTGRAKDIASILPLAVVVALLCATGLLMVLSASSVQSLREQGSSWVFFQRQALWLALGSLAMYLAARSDYRRWRWVGAPLLAAAIGLLFAVLLPGVGLTLRGATRWIDAGIISIQPSELAKLAVLLFGADLLVRRADRIEEPRAALVPMLTVLGVVGFLVMRQPDMGTMIVIAGIVGALLYVGGAPLPWMAALACGGTALGIVLAVSEPYRRERLMSFFDPWADPSRTGYQVVQSLVGMGSGRVTGVGLGESRAKWGFLPNAHTDFIFAIIGEELGLIGSMTVLVLFCAFAALGVRAALRAPDRYGALLAAGVTAWIVGQALVNIGAVVGLLPVTGVPMPFVSFGGAALLVAMVGTGLLMSVAAAGGPDAGGQRRARARHPTSRRR